DRLGLVTPQEQLSYGALQRRVRPLAGHLRRLGVGPNTLVALCLPRTARLLLGLLAVLCTGAGFVPLDPEQPVARRLGLLRASGAAVLLSETGLLAELARDAGEAGARRGWLALDAGEWEEADEGEEAVGVQAQAGDLAYQIYTSGSTGEPKGVLITQGALLNYTRGVLAHLRPAPGWHYGWVSPLAADLGYTSLFGCLLSGGCLHLADRERLSDGRAW